MIKTTKPDVTLDARYAKMECCRRLGEPNKPISIKTLNSYIAKLNIKEHVRKCNGKPFLTGADIIKIWNYSV